MIAPSLVVKDLVVKMQCWLIFVETFFNLVTTSILTKLMRLPHFYTSLTTSSVTPLFVKHPSLLTLLALILYSNIICTLCTIHKPLYSQSSICTCLILTTTNLKIFSCIHNCRFLPYILQWSP